MAAAAPAAPLTHKLLEREFWREWHWALTAAMGPLTGLGQPVLWWWWWWWCGAAVGAVFEPDFLQATCGLHMGVSPALDS